MTFDWEGAKLEQEARARAKSEEQRPGARFSGLAERTGGNLMHVTLHLTNACNLACGYLL